jgi:hypothetical protein
VTIIIIIIIIITIIINRSLFVMQLGSGGSYSERDLVRVRCRPYVILARSGYTLFRRKGKIVKFTLGKVEV